MVVGNPPVIDPTTGDETELVYCNLRRKRSMLTLPKRWERD